MAVVDPIADLLTRIRNAHTALHKKVNVPYSKLKVAMAEILKTEGYISDFAVQDLDIKITLKYAKGQPLIAGLKRISSPGRRVYVGVESIPQVQNGLGICILSTSQGILAGADAKTKNIGGELLCEIW
jgi:small subunit ribosomal protein S8